MNIFTKYLLIAIMCWCTAPLWAQEEVILKPKIRASKDFTGNVNFNKESIKNILKQIFLVDADALEQYPNVVRISGDELLGENNNIIWIANLPLGNLTGKFDIFKLGNKYQDPINGEDLGQLARVVASVEILEKNQDLAKMRIIKAVEPVVVGDYLAINSEKNFNYDLSAKLLLKPMEGVIIDVLSGMTAAKGNIVAVNLGAVDGLASGHLLDVYNDIPKDTNLLEESIGQIVIYNVFDKMSLGLVLSADKPIIANSSVMAAKLIKMTEGY